ncbi:MAG: hypothetical protein IJD80_02845 [Oscillospiraceae bacterium]|nr:hypothetical protein [Oscillospiraceae bacterium]
MVTTIEDLNVDIDFLYNDLINSNNVSEEDYSKLFESLSRTKSNIRKIAKYNDWEYFCVFTIDENNADIYNYELLSQRIRYFLNNYKTRYSSNFKYVIVPSIHENGTIHFIGMISGATTIYKPEKISKNINGEIEQVDNTPEYYVLPQYRLGHAFITKIRNKNKCGGLMMRRVNNFPFTKKGSRLLYASKGLNKKD